MSVFCKVKMSLLKGHKIDKQLLTMGTKEITRLEVMQRMKDNGCSRKKQPLSLKLALGKSNDYGRNPKSRMSKG